jgi:hypothetical protein
VDWQPVLDTIFCGQVGCRSGILDLSSHCYCRSTSNGRGGPGSTAVPDAPPSAEAATKRRSQPGTARRQLAGSPAAASQPGRPLEAVLLQLGSGAATADAAGWGGGDMGSWLEQQEAAAAEAAGPAPMPASPQGGSAGSSPGQRKASEVGPSNSPPVEGEYAHAGVCVRSCDQRHCMCHTL